MDSTSLFNSIINLTQLIKLSSYNKEGDDDKNHCELHTSSSNEHDGKNE